MTREDSTAAGKESLCGGLIKCELPRPRAISLRSLRTNLSTNSRAKNGSLATCSASHASGSGNSHCRSRSSTTTSSGKNVLSRVTDGPAAYLKMLSQPKTKKEQRDVVQGVAEELQSLTLRVGSRSSSDAPESTPELRQSFGARTSSLPSVFSRCGGSSGTLDDTDCSSVSGSTSSRCSSLSNRDGGPSTRATCKRRFSNESTSSSRSGSRHHSSAHGSTDDREDDDGRKPNCSSHKGVSQLSETDVVQSMKRGSRSTYGDEIRQSREIPSGRISRCSYRSSGVVSLHVAPFQMSCSYALRCFAASVRLRCPLSRLRVEDIEKWVEGIDTSLINCRWQEQPFLCVANVVLLHAIFEVAARVERIRTVCELRGVVVTSLFLAFSYGGHEISYPLRPFLYTNDRTLFWERCMRLTLKSSGVLLRLNSDEEAYVEALDDLLAHSR